MHRWRTWLEVFAITVLVLVAFFYAPVVPFVQSVAVPNYLLGASGTCGSPAPGEYIGAASQTCDASNSTSPVGLTGFATAAYGVIGLGSPPFREQVEIQHGNRSQLIFFEGSRPVAGEQLDAPDVAINPPSIVEIRSAPVTSSDFGFLNVTVNLRNIGDAPFLRTEVYLSMAGYSTNATVDGFTWILPSLVGGCESPLPPAAYCSVSKIVRDRLTPGVPFTYYVEIRGYGVGGPVLYRQGFGEAYPQGGVGPLWVGAFVDRVNQVREVVPLRENATLDKLAAIRFNSSSSVYQISDYGFSKDVSSFLGGGSALDAQEVLLYPSTYAPKAYATFLSQYAIGHWAALTNTDYTQYGYYVGQAPYYLVSVPCSVYEIPHGGLNITQFFSERGCSTKIQEVTWLVIVLTR